jgi:broad specificity phosphatase PhoE
MAFGRSGELHAVRPGRLRRLVLVRAGAAAGPREIGDPPLSERGRAQIEALRRRWEWAERVVSSTRRRARESALLLSRGGPVELDPDLAPLDRGRFAGLSPEDLRAADPASFEDWRRGREDFAFPEGEPLGAFRARVDRALARLQAGPWYSVLVVAHRDTIRQIAEILAARSLPPERPRIGELALVTRGGDGRWHLGRRSSDPEPLRSPLERTGLLEGDDLLDDRHVAPLELRPRRFP